MNKPKKKEDLSLEELFARLDDMGVTTPEPKKEPTPAPKPQPKPAPVAEEVSPSKGAKFAEMEAAYVFMTAGKATVTLVSLKTNDRFTYELKVSDDEERIYVALMTGPDNNSSFQFLGTIFRDRDSYFRGKKSKIGEDAKGNRAFKWAWDHIATRTPNVNLEIWHEGSCGRCGRKLTVPESIASGLGPECAGRV